MKLETNPRFPENLGALTRQLTDLWRPLVQQVNGLSEGAAAVAHNAASAAPTSGKYAVGDFIKNSNPSELGAPGSKYVVEGWLCITEGEPGTWVQKRFLTGN